MIYISSSCFQAQYIKNSIEGLALQGYKNIELSGGTEFYNNITEDILSLKQKYNLNLIIHNYFPPPETPFILNIGSLNKEINSASIEHVKRAIDLAKEIGATKYGIHAGFFFDPKLKQIGKRLDQVPTFNKQQVTSTFCDNYIALSEYAGSLPLYIENNVLSKENYESFNKQNVFMLTQFEDYIELKNLIDFPMILDVAHLFVSSNTLGLDFNDQIDKFIPHIDYIHVSDNNGLVDSNRAIIKDSPINLALEKLIKANKTITLEIYEGLDKTKDTYKYLNELIQHD